MYVQGLGPEGGTAALFALNDIFFASFEVFLSFKGLVAPRGLIVKIKNARITTLAAMKRVFFHIF